MNPLTIEQICRATNANPLNCDPAQSIGHICTDTRKCEPGCLFIAIKGDTHDGHDHVQTAIDGGAVAVMVDRDLPANLPQLRVADTRKAMGHLAAFVRSNLKSKVIAVAGSNGKTGTKNLIDSVLRDSLRGSISPKSFNNDIGVPSTIFAADPGDDYLVLEIGTNHHGEILNLTNIARPDVAVITNIGAEHLEFLGSLEGVRTENAQIIAGLNPDGLLILNGDSEGLLDAVAAYPGKKITFGIHPHNDLRATDIACSTDGVCFQLDGREIHLPLLGRHNAVNALAAIAVARYLGVADDRINQGLTTATAPQMRLQFQSLGNINILNDAYNANPNSMQAALETLRDLKTPGRRVAILGDMLELGDTANHYHRQIGHFAADCDLDLLICVGEKARLIAAAALGAGMPARLIESYPNAAACAAVIANLVARDDLVLLKASRGIKLEQVANTLQTTAAGDAITRELASRTAKILKETVSPMRA